MRSLSKFEFESPGVYFINILCAAFTREDPQSTKIQLSHLSFCTFGICMCKLRVSMLVELTPVIESSHKILSFFETRNCEIPWWNNVWKKLKSARWVTKLDDDDRAWTGIFSCKNILPLRPCKRWNIPNFVILRNSKHGIFRNYSICTE